MQRGRLWAAVRVPVGWPPLLGRMQEEIQPHEYNVGPKHITLRLRESALARDNLGVNKDFCVRMIFFFFFFFCFLKMMCFKQQ